MFEEFDNMSDSLKFLNDAHLWMAVAATILVCALVLAVCFYRRNRNAVVMATGDKEELEKGEARFLKDDLLISTSIEIPEKSPGQLKRLRHSLSLDAEFPVQLRKYSVQPAHYYRRAGSACCQRLSPTSLGTLQPDLYRSSESDNSSSPPTDAGRIWFSLGYNKETSQLEVALVRAKYLPGRGFSKTSRDPFVKLYLLPDEENYQQSKVRKKTLSPKFNETFAFNVREEELCSRCLRFSVYDLDKRKVRHCLGHAVISLAKVEVPTDGAIWRNLEKMSQPQQEGELQVALMCNPYNHRLKVIMCKAKNVEGMDSGGALVYARVQLFHGHKLLKSKKTASQTAMGPARNEFIFHETFSFSVPARFYDSCFLLLTTVVCGGATSRDAPHSKVTLGPFLFARGEGLLHWQEMVTSPRHLVTRWHKMEPVRPLSSSGVR